MHKEKFEDRVKKTSTGTFTLRDNEGHLDVIAVIFFMIGFIIGVLI